MTDIMIDKQHNAVDEKPQVSNKEYTYSDDQIDTMLIKYKEILPKSVQLLRDSKKRFKFANASQGMIILLSLIISYLTAISGIDETFKTYIVTAFSLLSAIISGLTTFFDFSNEGAKYYNAYIELKETCTYLENLMITLKCDEKYQRLVINIDKKVNKYELLIKDSMTEDAMKKKTTEWEKKITDAKHNRKIKLEQEQELKQKYLLEQEMKQKELEYKTKFQSFIERKRYIYRKDELMDLYQQYLEGSGQDLSYDEFINETKRDNKYDSMMKHLTDKINVRLKKFYTNDTLTEINKSEFEKTSQDILYQCSQDNFYQQINNLYETKEKEIRSIQKK